MINTDCHFETQLNSKNSEYYSSKLCSNKEGIKEEIQGTRQALQISEVIMARAINPEKDRAFNYNYSNIERLNECIQRETIKFNEKLAADQKKFRVTLSYQVTVDKINEKDYIAIARKRCMVHDDNYIPLSEYYATEQVLFADFVPPAKIFDSKVDNYLNSGNDKKDTNVIFDEYIKNQGKIITYIKRYALLQFMQPSKLEADPEDSDKRKLIKKDDSIHSIDTSNFPQFNNIEEE